MTTRAQDMEFRQAFDDLNTAARYIANCVVSGIAPPPEAIDRYTQAHGHFDRVVDAMAGAQQ